jgi:putative salt-induced outer membrane protein YdiY
MKYPTQIVGAVLAATAATALAQEAEAPGWKTSAGLNFALTSGNSDTLLIGANFNATKKWDQNELIGAADIAYGEATTVAYTPPATLTKTDNTTVNNFGAALQYNRLISERAYLSGRVDGRRDEIADIDYRFSGTVSAGYYFVKQKDITLSGEVGPGYVVEKLGANKNDYLTIRVGEKFTWAINERARLFQDLEFMPEASDFGNYIVQGQIGVEADLVKNLALRVTLQDTYRSRPAEFGNSGLFREENDLRLLAGINYKF